MAKQTSKADKDARTQKAGAGGRVSRVDSSAPTSAGRRNPKAEIELDEIVHAPARLLILATLSAINSADFTFLLKQTGLTRGNLSSHLSKLEEAGYVEIKKEFVNKIPRTLISLSKTGRAAFDQYRRNMKKLLGK